MWSYSDFILFFATYSFLGWMLETIFASINERKLINRGFLTSFFCPIYGFGAIMVIKSSGLLDNVFKDYLKSFIMSIIFSIILVTVLEYITGFLLEKIFDCKWWDYSDNIGNVHGYICIKYSLLWGFLAFILVKNLHPIINRMIYSIPIQVKADLAIFLVLYFFLDTLKSIIDAMELRRVILNYSKISLSVYYNKVLKYKRIFLAFPSLMILNAGIINRDIRSILNEKFDKIKIELKSRFQ